MQIRKLTGNFRVRDGRVQCEEMTTRTTHHGDGSGSVLALDTVWRDADEHDIALAERRAREDIR